MANIIKLMSATRAIGLLDGTIPWDAPEEFLEAAMYATHHETQCRPHVAASLYKVALDIANYAADTAHRYRSDSAGEAAAIQLILEAKGEITAEQESQATKRLLETGTPNTTE